MATKTTSECVEAEKPLQHDQFLFIEYSEAATSYANGVEIGIKLMTAFFTINGVLVAINQSPVGLVARSEVAEYLQQLAPVFGVIVSLLLAIFIPAYYRHLDNCLDRCCQIEGLFGGNLFIGNKKISERKINSKAVLYVSALTPLVLWLYQLYLSLS